MNDIIDYLYGAACVVVLVAILYQKHGDEK